MTINSHKRRRQQYLQRFKSCCYCDCNLSIENSTLEHILPKSWGGTNDPINLEISCRQCQRIHADIYNKWTFIRNYFIRRKYYTNKKVFNKISLELYHLLRTTLFKRRRRIWNPIYQIYPFVKCLVEKEDD